MTSCESETTPRPILLWHELLATHFQKEDGIFVPCLLATVRSIVKGSQMRVIPASAITTEQTPGRMFRLRSEGSAFALPYTC